VNGSNQVYASADRITLWLSRHWLALINAVLAVYVSLPFLAPAMMESGHPLMATIIYTIYAPLCHQLPQRSYFLFGEQATYSIQELADRVGEQNLPLFPWPRAFDGNAELGYKVALCERDVAIYGGLLASGLVFGLMRRRVRPISIWLYILIGLVPMGLDGGSQLISYVFPALFNGVPRESTWLLRTITGGLFGWATAWLALPNLQTAFAEMGEQSSQRLTGTRPTMPFSKS
jgi:uncharacterized membrane protein